MNVPLVGRGTIVRTAAAGILALAAGCRPPAPSTPPPPKVVATTPVRAPIVEWDEYVGRLAPIEEVGVRARVGGHLESTHFVEGQVVRQGDLLGILDQRPFRLAVAQAEADLARAKASAQEAAAQLMQAEAEVVSAESRRELAALLLNRARRLVIQNAASQEELDIRDTDSKQAVADRDVKKARVELAKSAVVTAAADVQAAKAKLETAQLNLGYTEVRAPVGGRISRRLATVGNLISGGTDQATLLTTIVSLDPIYCYFDADERSFLKYTRLVEAGKLSNIRDTKLPVFVRLADETNGYPHQGSLDFLDNRMDRGTATMRGRAILPNPDLTLTPGLFARVRIPGSGRYDAVLVPDSAVGSDQSEKYVMVVGEGSKIERRKVEVGRKARGLRIVREGLQGGESIVLRGLQRVRPGVVVEATREETVALDDGLPDEIQPLSQDRRPPSYSHLQTGRADAASGRVADLGLREPAAPSAGGMP